MNEIGICERCGRELPIGILGLCENCEYEVKMTLNARCKK